MENVHPKILFTFVQFKIKILSTRLFNGVFNFFFQKLLLLRLLLTVDIGRMRENKGKFASETLVGE